MNNKLWIVLSVALLAFGCNKGGGSPTSPSSENTIPGGPGIPEINLTEVPKKGSFSDLKGTVRHVLPANHKVSCVISVNGSWWPKPTYSNTLTTISSDGSWVCDVTTGGFDELATELRAYLVTSSYITPSPFKVPTVNGSDVLAVASATR